MNINPTTWGWNEWKAAGRHVGSYAAGAASVAVALNFISPDAAHQLTDAISNITDGVTKIATGVASLVAVLTPVYMALRAKGSAEPASQAKAVAEDLRKNGASALPAAARKEIIGAVAKMPEVQGVVVADKALASAIPEKNVVSTPDALKSAA